MIIKHSDVEKLIIKYGVDAFRITDAERLEAIGAASNEFTKYSEEERLNPKDLFPNAKSIIVFGLSYNYKKAKKKDGTYLLSRSSYGYDYHKVITDKLKAIDRELFIDAESESHVFVDTGPLVERLLAQKSGLGFLGKNTCIINPNLGSFIFIGYIISSEPSGYYDESLKIDCGSCDICERACPNGALCDYKMQMSKCLSYITQKKGELNDFEKKNIKTYIYGCDICQEVCPYNKDAKKVFHEEFHESDDYGLVYKEDFKLSNREFKEKYKAMAALWRGKKILQRNANIIDINKNDIFNERKGIMSNVHELGFLKDKIQELKDQGVYRKLPILSSPDDAEIILSGKKVINLSSNNYLGFANNPRIKKASIEMVEKYGAGSGAVRTIVGNMDIHEELEKVLAQFKREERAFIYQSGFNCNAGTIQAVTEKGDLIISDELNHASIIDGSRPSKADRAIFKHSDMDSLEDVLKEKRKNYRNVLIITDGVFSMDGDIAKLPDIVDLAEKYECMTYVDDAHGSGVLGENGRGTVDHFNLHGRVDFSIGTLSKAIGCIGGYVAGSETMYEWLIHRARPVLFSTSLTPASVGAITEAIKMLMESSEYTDKLWDNAKYFKEKLGKLGFNTGHSETPITPVIIGEEAKAMEFSRKLLENGVFVSAIVFPTVPRGTGRVRCMVTAGHTKEQLDEACRIFEKVGKEMNILQ